MKPAIFLFLALITVSSVYPQRLYKISVTTRDTRETLSFITRDGVDYASGKEIAKILWAGYFFNSSAGKLEIKFSNYSMKLSAGSRFVVIWRKSDLKQNVVQIPAEAQLMNEDVYFPVAAAAEYISFCYGKKLIYDPSNKSLKVTEDESPEPPGMAEGKSYTEEPRPRTPGKYDITGISIEEKTNGTLIRIKTVKSLPVPKHSINKDVLFVFLSGASVDPAVEKSAVPAGLVQEVKLNEISSNNIQLEFTLKEGYGSSEILSDPDGTDIIIAVHNTIFNAGTKGIGNAKAKWVFDAVVIDAGHGGKDPGAIGMTGVREKDVNLGIALKLGQLIEKNIPDVKVVYTRKTDEFIELYKRGKIANENNGKLFISIHCNSTEQKDIANRGYEVYLLRPGRTKQAIHIAEFENSVIKYEENPQRYQKLNDENFILVSMAHSQFMRYSEKFSDLLTQNWKKEVSIPALGIKQAGFYVLVGASMPGVLVENGFLSNRKDEAFLASQAGQKEIAQAILDAVKQYKDYYSRDVQSAN